MSRSERLGILLEALPGAAQMTVADVAAVEFEDQVILSKQVTYLGNPWPVFKKRIQIPPEWKDAHRDICQAGRRARFVGVYRHEGTVVFVDFDPAPYVSRKANNSAAHVATNDLYQALTLGTFSRTDSRGNRLTAIRPDLLASYLRGETRQEPPVFDVFRMLNADLIGHGRIEALDAVREMHAASWPDTYQAEWPGFYLEYRVDRFVRAHDLEHLVRFQKDKGRGRYDYDLVIHADETSAAFFGDLKASDIGQTETPANDAEDLLRCVRELGRFWYVVYEHQTLRARDDRDRATVAWNEWKRSTGYFERRRRDFDRLSYAPRFKASVEFVRMFVLEVNPANVDIVLGDFHQGRQQGGADRAIKKMIRKENIDNFVVFSAPAP